MVVFIKCFAELLSSVSSHLSLHRSAPVQKAIRADIAKHKKAMCAARDDLQEQMDQDEVDPCNSCQICKHKVLQKSAMIVLAEG